MGSQCVHATQAGSVREVNGPVRWGWLVGLNVVLGVVGHVPMWVAIIAVTSFA